MFCGTRDSGVNLRVFIIGAFNGKETLLHVGFIGYVFFRFVAFVPILMREIAVEDFAISFYLSPFKGSSLLKKKTFVQESRLFFLSLSFSIRPKR